MKTLYLFCFKYLCSLLLHDFPFSPFSRSAFHFFGCVWWKFSDSLADEAVVIVVCAFAVTKTSFNAFTEKAGSLEAEIWSSAVASPDSIIWIIKWNSYCEWMYNVTTYHPCTQPSYISNTNWHRNKPSNPTQHIQRTSGRERQREEKLKNPSFRRNSRRAHSSSFLLPRVHSSRPFISSRAIRTII